METLRTVIETLYGQTEEYGKTSFELAKLKSLETTTVVVSTLISRLSVVVMLLLFVLVLNIGIALWLGELLGRTYYGFFIIAGFYLLTGLMFHFFLHRWIKKPISELIITQVLQ